MMFAGNDKKPVGGHILAHACHPQILPLISLPLYPFPISVSPSSLPDFWSISGDRTLESVKIVLDGSSATRIYLRKGRAEERVAKLQDSPDRPEKEASYQITEGGITDIG